MRFVCIPWSVYMSKNRIKIIVILVPVLLIAILVVYFILYNKQNDYLDYDYSRGKTPGTSYIAFTEDYLIYKEDVPYDNRTPTDILILEDTMYYLKGNQEDSTSLYAMS